MIYLIIIVVILILIFKSRKNRETTETEVRHTTSQKNEGRSHGLGRKLLGGMAILIVIAVLFGGGSNDEQTDGSATFTPYVTSTPKATKTPKPTAMPTPTVTSVPDFAGMSSEVAVQALAEYYENTSIEFESVVEFERLVNVQAKITDKIWNEKMAVQRVCQYVLHISEHAFKNPGVDSLVFYFDAEMRDVYGNLNNSRVININISRATAEKINYDWMIDRVYVSTKEVLAVFDDYTVHSAFTKGIN